MKMNTFHSHIIVLIFFLVIGPVYGNNTAYLDGKIYLDHDSLILENSKIRRTYTFNQGNLITQSIFNKTSNFTWHATDNVPDMNLPGTEKEKAELVSFRTYVVEETLSQQAYLEAEIIYTLGNLSIKRILRLYPACPAIGMDFYFKGNGNLLKYPDESLLDKDLSDVKFVASQKARSLAPVMEKLSLDGKHWNCRVVDLSEMTDHLNDLVTVNDYQTYQERLFRGNILFAKDMENEEGVFLLKEAPSPNAQLQYLSGDYLVSFGQIRMLGFGIDSEDIRPDRWTPGYSAVCGVFSKTEYSALKALKTYQNKLRKRIPETDEMVMMNTWGDRGQDSRINEKYIIEELELCAKLGISHFQIDDGWQTGKSPASIGGGSFDNIWESEDYWLPNKANFPDGFTSILKKGKELGIEICLWFNPSYTDNYVNWRKDAEVLAGLYKKYGIRTFKIDGLRIHNKISELRVDSLLNAVQKASGYDAVINLDVTADKRFGYLYKNEYGNIFLENRYTDFGNYYPYWTLRNLWCLSKYVPAQNLQIEFLNKWRNENIYKNDTFAPKSYDFEYLFAITMMAQPLAWMEAHNLPAEAFSLGKVIEKYRTIQQDIHKGDILPIGEKPDGRSWTGFQSLQDNQGYFLVFRELNDQANSMMKTWLKPGAKIRLKYLLGNGTDFEVTVNERGEVPFSLKTANHYGLYKYTIIK